MSSKQPYGPPKWLDNLLSSVLEPHLYEGVMGDLEEKYSVRRENRISRWKSNLYFILEGLGFLRLTRLSSLFKNVNPTIMYKSYLQFALRNMSRDKLYVFLNVAGLAIGITSILVIYTYAKFELSYDSYHTKSDRIYRIAEEFMDDGSKVKAAMNHAPMAPLLTNNLSDAKSVTRIFVYTSFFNAFVNSTPDRLYKEKSFVFADSTFFRSFTYTPIDGNLATALDEPFSVVITEKTAIKYFDSAEKAMGQEITFQDDEDTFKFNVTAVIEEIPQNSHMRFDFMASFSSMESFMPWYNNWHYPPMYIYIETHQPVNETVLSEKIQRIAKDHQPEYVLEEDRQYLVQPIESIHLFSHLDYEWEANSNYSYIQIYILTGIFILLIACINFMNMATARSSRRVKEIGMRKVLGGRRQQLIAQFLTESGMYCLVAFLIAIGLAELSLKTFFGSIIDKELTLLDLATADTVLIAIGFLIVLSFIAGIYPSMYLSAFRPIKALNGKLSQGKGSLFLRKGLVTVQIFISCLIISVTLIVLNQVNYMREKNLGFNQEHVVSVKLSDRFAQRNYEVLKENLLSQSSVSSAALSSTLPGAGNYYGFSALPEGEGEPVEMSIKTIGVDEDFIQTYDLEILEGRGFSKDVLSDQTQAFVLNEAAVDRLNWEEPIGMGMELTVYIDGAKKYDGKVIGVIKDFNFQSLHTEIEPLLLYINKHPYYADYLSVKFNDGNIANTVATLESTWKSFNPDKPLEFAFLDDQLNRQYESEIRISKVFNVLALLSIIVSALGLFGLSAFIAERRTQEMGIRKVMGASTLQMIFLQLREFFLLVIIANLAVWPITLWWTQDWLSGFAYRIEVNPLIFVLTFIAAIVLVVITLSYHSLKVARMNPVKSLRYE